MKRLLLFALLAGAVAVPVCFSGDQTHQARPLTADQLQWAAAPNRLPSGAQMAVLDGDPMHGAFVVRLKAPNGYTIPPHWHPTWERVTVISGAMKIGMGDQIEESKMQTLTQGGFVALPAEHHHYARTSGETIVQIQGDGPFQITYVNANDDPQNKKRSGN